MFNSRPGLGRRSSSGEVQRPRRSLLALTYVPSKNVVIPYQPAPEVYRRGHWTRCRMVIPADSRRKRLFGPHMEINDWKSITSGANIVYTCDTSSICDLDTGLKRTITGHVVPTSLIMENALSTAVDDPLRNPGLISRQLEAATLSIFHCSLISPHIPIGFWSSLSSRPSGEGLFPGAQAI